MFPTAGSTIYRNEDGEVLGWDTHYDDAPDPDLYYDAVDEGVAPGDYDCGGEHGDAHQVDGDLWECDICGETFSYFESRGRSFDS